MWPIAGTKGRKEQWVGVLFCHSLFLGRLESASSAIFLWNQLVTVPLRAPSTVLLSRCLGGSPNQRGLPVAWPQMGYLAILIIELRWPRSYLEPSGLTRS